MTERERFVRTLTCNSPDRPSYGDYFAYAATQQRWEREGLPAGLSRQGLYDHFGFDHVDIWGNDRLGLNDTILPAYQPCVLEETPEHTVRREGSGTVMRVLKNTPPPAMPQFLGYPVTDRSSWADFRQRLDPDTPGRFTPALAELARQSPQRTTPLGVWLGGTYGYIRNWMGVEKASCLFYDDPRLVEEMIEHLTGFYSA
jgi:hypothetical protein